MKKILIPLAICCISLCLTACNDDFLDTKSRTQVERVDIWKESGLAEAYMFDIYFAFQDAGFSEEAQSSAVDETVFTHADRGFKEFNEAAFSESNLGWFGKTQSGHQWNRLYKNIRSCNDFIENIDKATFEGTFKDQKQLKGEAYFLRAYFVHRLTRAFGGVPLQLRVTQLFESDYSIPRNTYTECIDQIVSDIDSASHYLKDMTVGYTEKGRGRATLAACKALKIRVLTDAASDLHNQATATAQSELLASYAHKELLFYTKGSRAERWMAVKNAAKEFMDNPMGYALSDYGGNGLTPEEKADAIQKFFLKENSESIFSRYFINTKDESGTWIAKFNGPCGYRAWGGNTPIQELVDDFYMEDGSRFDWKNPAHMAAPYKNREPRFYASIMYDGMQWRPRPENYALYDPYSQIQTGYYQLDPAVLDKSKFWHGLDTRTGAAETWNGTYTGYYMKKFIDASLMPHSDKGQVPWPFIRYTEVVMDYLEACIELGELTEAQQWLNFFRNRVGLPDSEARTQAELRKAYQTERRLEMVFEEQRYWDIRRWMVAGKQPGITGLHGIDVIATLKPQVPKQETYHHDDAKYNYTYTVIDLSGKEARQWKDKGYFLPISRDEMNRNNKLIQNPN